MTTLVQSPKNQAKNGNRSVVPSVNFHLWQPCNMRCKFCFATFQDVKKTVLPKGHLPENEALEVVKRLAEYGFEKMTFVGGEPTLCPWLSQLIRLAKEKGMTTMLVTNGTQLHSKFLQENRDYLDWITLSIDSLNPKINEKAGRKQPGKPAPDGDFYSSLIKKIKQHDYKFKMNTVVHAENVHEDFHAFIRRHEPVRWKVFQVLPIEGQNDGSIGHLAISNKDYHQFQKKHEDISQAVFESNDDLTASYAMVDPAGRFFDNTRGTYYYSQKILDVGVERAIQEVAIDQDKFKKRGGHYDWAFKNANK